MTTRTLSNVIEAIHTSDGAGVKLRRSLGQSQAARLDPFLMLDHFSTDDPDDYIAGFPAHPHRGFETVTYMLDGHLRHQDHLGHTGELRSGGVQWMTAGRGIVHSEMPQQEKGRMRGFQLWINLPAREKMKPAGYRDIQPDEIPVVELASGARVKVIAGTLAADGVVTPGPIRGLTTDPLYFDVTLPPHARFEHAIPAGYHAFVYVFEGSVSVGPHDAAKPLGTHKAGIFSDGDTVEVSGGAEGGRFILLAGRPLGEPVVQYGPFVMNTPQEIERAIRDYQSGELTRAAS
jgi:redox-sensitive bicupin YhaK (pirin superfamily)